MLEGLSLVICTFNGAARLPRTLSHLAAQTSHAFEVLVIDNASTDDTAAVARKHWPADAPASLRVIREDRIGKSHALETGFANANHELVAIIDDDNWLAPDWVAKAIAIMKQHPRVGALGGWNEPAFESDPPAWFTDFGYAYATGPQGDAAGPIGDARGFLFGAGTVVRKAAWDQLAAAGFRQLLSCRSGTKLSSGGDTEICLALRLAGWELWYDPALRLEHFMPAPRLNWGYLVRLYRSFGESMPIVRAYQHHLGIPNGNAGGSWWRDALRKGAAIVGRPRWLAKKLLGKSGEGHLGALQLESHRGTFGELLRQRGRYDESFRTIGRLKERLKKT